MDSDDEPIVFKRSSATVIAQQQAAAASAGKSVPPAPSLAKKAPEPKREPVESFVTKDVDMGVSDSEDNLPIGARIQPKPKEDSRPKKRPSEGSKDPTASTKKPKPSESDSEADDVPLAQLAIAAQSSRETRSQPKRNTPASTRKSSSKGNGNSSPRKNSKKESTSNGGGEKKWMTLEHNGVIFPPPYTPHGVKILYKGKPVDLTPEQEEVATMFAVMRETEYAMKPVFKKNFWSDWKQVLGSRHVIQNLDDCDFTPIWEWHVEEKEKKKLLTSEEKKKIKEEKLKQEDKFMYAIVDGVKEKVGNFRVEPPGLFRGRGEHPKMGKLKKRIYPEDITINVGKTAPIPECPIPGHRWKEVRHDNSVTWLAFWNDPINPKEFKYVFLAASSSLKGQSDKEKYEKARKLKEYIVDIRNTYTRDFDSSDLARRQIAVATYLIDRLALRAGNEKDEDEADTVGCCSLKYEHVELVPPHSIQFDFLGKDSIRYFNTVEVEPKVYKAIGEFRRGKRKGDDLFDMLDTTKLNTHLKEIMPGLTAKVFRTYNASITLDNLLQDTVGQNVVERVADYQRANKEVAILCNHQRTVSKAHAGQMEKLNTKMADLEATLKEQKEDLQRVLAGQSPKNGATKRPQNAETLEKKVKQTLGRIDKMKLDMAVKEDLKTVALGTSKINYMDPRISVAWCKLHDIPIEKVFNKSLLAKFAWAMDVEPEYRF